MVLPRSQMIFMDEDAGELDLPPDERTLRERARWLAAETSGDDPDEAESTTEMLDCRLHDEWYAIELSLLSAVQVTQGLTPIPCTPPFVAGMLNVRGTVVVVLDLARGLGLAEGGPADAPSVLLTDCAPGGQGQVGLLVHEIVGVSRLALDRLDRAFSGNPAVRGIAEAGIVVLDLRALLADGRFEVTEEW